MGQYGGIAVIERFIRTLKEGCTRRIVVALHRNQFRRELQLFVDWYNQSRPHNSLGGKTPDEVYHHKHPAKQRPRIEPRKRWPRGSPCAVPQTLVAGQPGDRFTIKIDFQAGRKHLPVVTLKHAA